MELVLALIIFLLIIGYTSFSWGFVVHKFYYWFILPMLPTWQHFDIIQFIAIMFFVSCFHRNTSLIVKDEYRKKEQEWILLFVGPWIMLFTGWVFKLIFLN